MAVAYIGMVIGSQGEPNNYINVIGNTSVNVLEWLSSSLNVTPIDNIRAEFKTRVYARQPLPKNVQPLRYALIKERNNTPQNHIAKVIGSMRGRYVPCIQVKETPITKVITCMKIYL